MGDLLIFGIILLIKMAKNGKKIDFSDLSPRGVPGPNSKKSENFVKNKMWTQPLVLFNSAFLSTLDNYFRTTILQVPI